MIHLASLPRFFDKKALSAPRGAGVAGGTVMVYNYHCAMRRNRTGEVS
jgi:hypothetical protein